MRLQVQPTRPLHPKDWKKAILEVSSKITNFSKEGIGFLTKWRAIQI